MNKKMIKKDEKLEEYDQLLKDVKSILQRGLSKAYKAVDNIKVQAYWQVGERIVREELEHKERAGYGKKVIEMLAEDLKCSRGLMFEIVQFYRVYQIVHTLYGQLSWSHYRELIKIKIKSERSFYEQQTIQNVWGVRELRKQIRNRLYETAKKTGKLTVTVPLVRIAEPKDIFKEKYHFDFLNLDEEHTERGLELAMLNKIEKILLELGYGFAFVARQKPIIIARQKHWIDLLFYHISLGCYVIIELKTERFQDKFVGQVNKYLTYVRENEMYDYMRDPIGLIICKEKNDEEVHYALGKLKEDIFVAEYKIHLPSEKEIKIKLRALKNENK